MSADLNLEQFVIQQLAFARTHLKLLEENPPIIKSKALKQAFILQMSLILKGYLCDLASLHIDENLTASLNNVLRAFVKNTALANPEFRVQEVRQLIEKKESWLWQLGHMELACVLQLAQKKDAGREPESANLANANLISVVQEFDGESATESTPWWEYSAEDLAKLLGDFENMLAKHKEGSAEG